MALELKQQLKLSQQLVMTPQLQQAIKLLQLSRMELQTEILNALAENPVLEEPEATQAELREEERDEQLAIDRAEPEVAEPAPDAVQEVRAEESPSDIDWEAYLNNFQLTGPTAPSNSGLVDLEDLPSHEARFATRPTLVEHLLNQIGADDGPVQMDPEERRLATHVIGNLDRNGFFRIHSPGENPDPAYVPAPDPLLDPDGALEPWLDKKLAQLDLELRRRQGLAVREERREDPEDEADGGAPAKKKARNKDEEEKRDPDSPWKWSSEDPVDPLIRLVTSRWGARQLSRRDEEAFLDERCGPADPAFVAALEAEAREEREARVRRVEEKVVLYLRKKRAIREADEAYRGLSEREKREEHRNWEEYCARWSHERSLAREKAAQLVRDRQEAEDLRPGEPAISFALAARVLEKCQRLDPPGVCARDLPECLLIQARAQGLEDDLVGTIIKKHLKHLEAKNLTAIAREEKVPVEEVAEAAELLAAFEARPARGFVDEDPRYITPDVYIQKVGDRYEVVMNDDGLSKLRIGRRYVEALRSGSAGEYIQERLRAAKWLIRSIHQRQRTIHKVTESIIKFQQDFLDKGIAHLKPLILKDVAEDIGMHESTVSRVTTNKYVHTPQGIFELKYFFNSGISRTGGDEVASEAVKNEIRNIVAGESGKAPYSDQKIVEILHGRGIEIARRTVAKYREVLGILPSSKRRSFH